MTEESTPVPEEITPVPEEKALLTAENVVVFENASIFQEDHLVMSGVNFSLARGEFADVPKQLRFDSGQSGRFGRAPRASQRRPEPETSYVRRIS